MEERINVTITTDGACSGNHLRTLGEGGYAAILRFGKGWKEIAGYVEKTTNNRTELMGPINAISALKKPCTVTLRTDSQIVINAVENLEIRATNGWKTKTGAKCANIDLLMELYKAKHDGNHEIICEYTKGHSGDPDNERCDFLAKQAIKTKERFEARGTD